MDIKDLSNKINRLEETYKDDMKEFKSDIRDRMNDSKGYYESLIKGYSESMGELITSMNTSLKNLSDKVDNLVTATNKHATYFALVGTLTPLILGAIWAVFTFFYKP